MSTPPLSPLEMSVRSADGIILKGQLEYPETAVGSRYPMAILAHQYPATCDSYGPLVDDLLDLGVAALAFDLRGHGSSITGPGGPVVIDTPVGFTPDDFGRAFMASAREVGFDRIDDDILRVASWGASQNYIDTARLMLVGASVGGSAALLAAPRIQGLRAAVTLGAAGAPAWGEDGPARVRKAVEGLKARCYLASSEHDPFSGADNVRNWSQGLAHVSTRIVAGNAHAMAIYYDVRDELLEWIRGAMK
ncbi:MAG: alpha/beta hydrolase family protein [Gemmatimonadales bacterium]